VVRARPLQLEEGTGDAGGAGGVPGAGAVDVAPPHQPAAEEGGMRPIRPVPDGGALREVRAACGCLGQEEAGEAAAVGFEGAVSRVEAAADALDVRRPGVVDTHGHAGDGRQRRHGKEDDDGDGERKERGILHGGGLVAADDDGDGDEL